VFPGHVQQLFSYSVSSTDDSETQAPNDSETQAPEGLHDAHPEDETATQALGENQVRTIGKYIIFIKIKEIYIFMFCS
jgi:hypothetical protein